MTARWTVRIVLAGIAVLLMMGLPLAISNGTFEDSPTSGFATATVAAYILVGGLLAVRLPRNPIGLLFLVAGFFVLLSGVTQDYARYTLGTNPGALPFGLTAAWIQNWASFGLLLVPILVLLFPTGTVPSPPWRWVLRLNIVCVGALLLLAMFTPAALDVAPGIQPENPFGIAALEGRTSPLLWVFGLGLLGVTIASIVGLVQRFRRSTGEERQQIKWFATAAAVTGGCLDPGPPDQSRPRTERASPDQRPRLPPVPHQSRDRHTGGVCCRDLEVPPLRPRPRGQEDRALRDGRGAAAARVPRGRGDRRRADRA